MKTLNDYKSRFKILKGGKIALVISILMGTLTLSFAAPSGESIVSGDIVIDRNIVNTTNINQSTNKGIINWQSFDVNTNETVNFNMPNTTSSTLNRVLSNNPSNIYGQINSNGQVFLVNQNGIYFSESSQINTAGFTASTLDITNENFLNSNYIFEGTSNASILNLGAITTDNAYTALLAKEVINEGVIQADGGIVYLTTKALDTVLNGVVNNTGVIEVNSVEEKDGKIILFAHGGTAKIDGTISAKDGFVETSAKELNVEASTKVTAGTWLLDPTNLVVESSGGTDLTGSSVSATAIENALTSADVELQADLDITVNENITWAEATKLTLSAGDEVYVNAAIENTNSTTGGVYFNAANTTDKVIFGGSGKVVVNNVNQLQWINQALNGTYELGSNVDASDTSTWNGGSGFVSIGDAITKFIGSFDGQNYTISNLYINRPTINAVGLFGRTNTRSSISNLGLVDVDITGGSIVGGLVGDNFNGTISNSYSTGSVSGIDYVGGLVGSRGGTITDSFWDTQTSGQTTSVGGEGKTTAQMKDTKTFYDAGWDLDTIWGRDTANSENSGYLDLRALNSGFTFNTVVALTLTDQTKVYDGTADVTTTLSKADVIESVAFTGNKNVDTYAFTSTLGDYGLTYATGFNSGNTETLLYNSGSQTITQKALTLSAITASDKVYDGTTDATTTATLAGIITGDTVTNSITSTFDNKNAGIAKTVTLDSVTLAGADSANYSIATGQTTTADVTQKALTLSAITASDKVYDGTTDATTTATLAGLIAGDSVSIASTFDNKNVGIAKTVTLNSLAGADGANYSATLGQTTTADITTPNYQNVFNDILRETGDNNKQVKDIFMKENNLIVILEDNTQSRLSKVSKEQSDDNLADVNDIKLALIPNRTIELFNSGLYLPDGLSHDYYMLEESK